MLERMLKALVFIGLFASAQAPAKPLARAEVIESIKVRVTTASCGEKSKIRFCYNMGYDDCVAQLSEAMDKCVPFILNDLSDPLTPQQVNQLTAKGNEIGKCATKNFAEANRSRLSTTKCPKLEGI